MSYITFPSNLPGPLPDYSDVHVDTRTMFQSETAHVRRRRRSRVLPRRFELTWDLSGLEFTIFDTWFNDSVQNGVLEFDLQLLDNDRTLVWYSLQVPSGQYQADLMPSMSWRVTMTVQTIKDPSPTRVSGSSNMSTLATIEVNTTGRLALPGVRLRTVTDILVSATGSLLIPFRGSALVDSNGTGRIPVPLYTNAIIDSTGTGRIPEILRTNTLVDSTGTGQLQ